MTIEQLEKQNIKRDGHTFTPRYTYQKICLEDGTIDFDYTITASAEEVYKEWLEQQKPKPPTPSKTEIWQGQMEAGMAELAKKLAQNTLLK